MGYGNARRSKGQKSTTNIRHAGFVAISKDGAPKEQDMLDALNFLDICNTKEGQNLLNYGVEGVHYDLNEKGELREEHLVKTHWKDSTNS